MWVWIEVSLWFVPVLPLTHRQRRHLHNGPFNSISPRLTLDRFLMAGLCCQFSLWTNHKLSVGKMTKPKCKLTDRSPTWTGVLSERINKWIDNISAYHLWLKLYISYPYSNCHVCFMTFAIRKWSSIESNASGCQRSTLHDSSASEIRNRQCCNQSQVLEFHSLKLTSKYRLHKLAWNRLTAFVIIVIVSISD